MCFCLQLGYEFYLISDRKVPADCLKCLEDMIAKLSGKKGMLASFVSIITLLNQSGCEQKGGGNSNVYKFGLICTYFMT